MTPAPRPPIPTEDAVAALRLLRTPRIGPVTYRRLVAAHGSAAQALAALPKIARDAGAPDPDIPDAAAIARELAQARRLGAHLLVEGGAGWPSGWAALDDAPPLAWCRGDPALLSRPCAAVIGARNASSLGLRMARRLAGELSEAGVLVASGLARGIDAAAHAAALKGGTVAVVGGGADVAFPPENADLMAEVAARGAILSEQPMGLRPQARHFPRRNRLIAAMAQVLVVVEAAAKSGSLSTARLAADLGRDVGAVPGHPFDGRAWGCNALIRDGALLVRGADDVLELMRGLGGAATAAGPGTARRRDDAARAALSLDAAGIGPVPLAPGRAGAALTDRVLAALGPSPIAPDALIRSLGASGPAVTAALTELELEGRITRAPGGLISLA
ncbi:MAG: DNA-processing protein DprA [Paracoccaceae bacterium]